jgi:hypothetical protein
LHASTQWQFAISRPLPGKSYETGQDRRIRR